MILPDANLLIYARNAASPEFEVASKWWANCLDGGERIGLTWAVLMTYLRICSSPRVFPQPVAIGDLVGDVEDWVSRRMVRVVEPTATHLQAIRSIAEPLGLGGDIMNDVHLAALSIEYGAVVHTADRDFARFRGVRWFNPLD